MAGDRLERLRAQQAGAATMTPAQAAEAILAHIQPHEDHAWRQIGRCVYCGPCAVRLYQGGMPPDHEVFTPPRKPTAADRMREQWGKP